MLRVEFGAGALQDIFEAFDWYDERSPQTAERFRAAVQATAEQAAANPSLYAAVDARHRNCPIRHFPFRIVYRVDEARCIIVAVAHKSRRPGYWRERS